MKFDDVIGQEHVKQRLMQMANEGRVPHALLFCGTKGAGKMSLALAFASYLLTHENGGTENSNNSSNAEAMLRKWEHPDLHFTYPTVKLPGMGSEHQPVSDDFAREWHGMLMQGSYFTLDKWMESMNADNQQAVITGAESDELSRKLSLKSSQGGYKISIIWLPERMNRTSANKLLKLLEEPPMQTVFLLVSEEPGLLLDTIRSRTQRIDVQRISTETIERKLIELRGIDEEAAKRIARVANGSWTRALEELDTGNENRMFLDLFIMLMRLAYMRNIKELKKWSETAASNGREKQKRMLVYFQHMIRENFIYNFRKSELNYMTLDEENFSKNFARFINENNVIEISELLAHAERDITQNANGKIVFFDLALRMIMLLIQK